MPVLLMRKRKIASLRSLERSSAGANAATILSVREARYQLYLPAYR